MQRKLLVVTELPDKGINDLVAKKFAHRIRSLVVSELIVSGIQCTLNLAFTVNKCTRCLTVKEM